MLGVFKVEVVLLLFSIFLLRNPLALKFDVMIKNSFKENKIEE